MTIALRQRPLARVVAGIVRANNGLLFDIGDMSTLYQDAAGTTPVTAVEQPVGKVLDKSGNNWHATQSITASRPTLSARKNVLLATETLATQSVNTLAATYTLSFTGTGSVTLSGTSTGALTGTGTDRVSRTFTPTAGTLALTVSGSVTKAQLELGAVVTSYQRVTTATDYDVSAHYYFLRFDGVDDYLNLPYMGLYANGSASVVAGVSLNNYASQYVMLSESSGGSGTSLYYLGRQAASSGQFDMLIRNDASVVALDSSGITGISNSIPRILSCIDSGVLATGFNNSSLIINTTYSRANPTTLAATTIGATVTASAFNFANMNLYGLVVTKSPLTDSQRVRCERFLAQKAGVML